MARWTRRATLLGLGATSLLFACSTPASQFTATVEAQFPPIGQFVKAAGTRIHYDRRGSGPAVVLIHGASGNLRDFTFALSDALAEQGFTAIAVDRPGHGYSERGPGRADTPSAQATILREAVTALEIERPIVLGHSYGGAVAAAWAVDAPESLSGAVLVSGLTYAWPAGDNAYHAAAATAVFGPSVNALVRNRALNGGARRAVEWVFQPQDPPAGYADFIGAELASRPATFRENGRDISNVNAAMAIVSQGYPDLKVPVELLHGTADKILPIEDHARRFKAANPAVRLTELPGVGHMAHQVAKTQVIDAVKRLAAKDPRVSKNR